MRRRDFISLLGGAAVAWPLPAAAQQGINSKRLAIFSPSEPSADLHEHSESKFSRTLFAELRRLGQVEGQNLQVERYGREQNTSGPEALATEIVRSNPNVIWVVGPGAVIFKKLTSRIPIVAITGDPVKQGIADSLAHRGAISRELASTPVKPFMDDASKRCLACSSSTHPKRIVWPVIDAFVGTGRTAMILNTEMRDVRQRCLPMPGTVARGAGTVLGDPASPKSIRTALSRTSCLNGASGPGCSLAQASRPVYAAILGP